VGARLQCGDLVGVLHGHIMDLRGIVGERVEFEGRWQLRSPVQLSNGLADAGAEWFDIIN